MFIFLGSQDFLEPMNRTVSADYFLSGEPCDTNCDNLDLDFSADVSFSRMWKVSSCNIM